MKRKVYLGDFNNHKKRQLIDFSLEKLREGKGDEFYYILPNGELIRHYRRFFIDELEYSFHINLFTFDDIVKHILEDDFTPIIDNPTKNLILRGVCERLIEEGRLVYYKDFTQMPGFINSVNDIIGDIKRSLIYPEDYLARSPDKPFYKEMGLIYQEYEEALKGLKLWDREGSYFKSIDLLKDKAFLRGVKTIIIDEFYDFRPVELAIIKELAKEDMDIIINIPFLTDNKSIILEDTLTTLRDLGFEVEYLEKEELTFFEKMAKKLFTSPGQLDSSHHIRVIKAATPYLELRRIFQELKAYHKEGIPLKDMAIIISNPIYLEPLLKVAKGEGLPLSKNITSPLKAMPIIREVLNILECRLYNYDKLSLINRIKSNYFRICQEDKMDLYELILRKEDFTNLQELTKLFDSNRLLNMTVEEMEEIKKILGILEAESSSLSLKGRISSYNNFIRDIIRGFKLKENILNRYAETQDEYLFLRDLRSLKKLEGLIDRMDLLGLMEEEISLEDYYYLLLDYIEEEAIVEIQANREGVQLLTPTNARGLKKRVIYVTGLSQGSFPSLDMGNYFINDYNQKDLEKIGIHFKNYQERLNNETLKFASILASCQDKLILSYSSGYDDDNIKSIFLEEVISLFNYGEEEEGIEEIRVNLDYLIKRDLEDVTNTEDLSKYLLRAYAKGEDIDEETIRLHNQIYPHKFRRIKEKLACELNRYGDTFDEYRGLLADEAIKEDVAANLPKGYSISYLEAYSRCPYYFLLNRLFEIEEMEREFIDYSPIDLGLLYHDVLNRYYSLYREELKQAISKKEAFDFEKSLDSLKAILNTSAKEIGFNLSKKKDKLIVEIIFKRLRAFLEKDIERMIKEGILPYAFEVDFGSKIPFFIEVKGTKIPLVGRIDRIDKFIDEDKFIAIDYKSSSYGLRDVDHMRTGLSLQLPVYILSQEDKEMVAGAYGIISSQEFKINLGLSPYIRGKSKGILSQEEWDQLMDLTKENIYRLISNIGEGNFQVNPLECSAYCIYKDICRFEDLVEVE